MNNSLRTTSSDFPYEASGKKIVVGMSGGVDSSVTAYLLRCQSHDVHGVFMKNWQETDPEFPCTAAEDARDALGVCENLGIELDAVDFSREYWQRVFAYFLDEYRRGRTPNPDILCNKEIKFKAFLDHALAQGAEYIATGHYARIREVDGRYQLLKAKDSSKDQTYFLYTLGQSQLARSLFPVGELQKYEVRRIAAEQGFANAAKKDSTGICFIGERDFNSFLSRYLPAQPGEIRTPDGKCLGAHNGLMYYTLGQRKGIGIGGRKAAAEMPWYVVDKDMASNTLIVAQGHDHPLLYSRGLLVGALHWVSGDAPGLPLRCMAKTRYRQADQNCNLRHDDGNNYVLEFEQAQRAVTPGQSVVFYQGDICLGGGIIEQIHR
jgi:tRNA-specific 2-thiouridylase